MLTSAIQGYFYPYIVTQDPLSTTVFDFWRLIHEYTPTSIVMLSDETNVADAERYWPEKIGDCRQYVLASSSSASATAVTASAINVKLISDERHSTYRQRTLTYSKHGETAEKEVVQFAFTEWPSPSSSDSSSSPTPSSTGALLDLIGRVLKRQTREQTTAGPIVVHCRWVG